MKIGVLNNYGTINDIHDAQVVLSTPGEQMVQASPSTNNSDGLSFDNVPAILCSPRAKELWTELYKAGYVNNKCVTTRSRTESAVMAKIMADKLGLTRYWQDFSDLWQMTNLKAAGDKANYSTSCDNFEKKIKCLFT